MPWRWVDGVVPLVNGFWDWPTTFGGWVGLIARVVIILGGVTTVTNSTASLAVASVLPQIGANTQRARLPKPAGPWTSRVHWLRKVSPGRPYARLPGDAASVLRVRC